MTDWSRLLKGVTQGKFVLHIMLYNFRALNRILVTRVSGNSKSQSFDQEPFGPELTVEGALDRVPNVKQIPISKNPNNK